MKFRFLVFLNFYVLSTFCKSIAHSKLKNQVNNTSGQIFSIQSIMQAADRNKSKVYSEKTNVGLKIITHLQKSSKDEKGVKRFGDELNGMKKENEKITEKHEAMLQSNIFKFYLKKKTE